MTNAKKSLLFLITMPAAATVYGPLFLLWRTHQLHVPSLWWQYAGLLPIGGAAWLTAWSGRDFAVVGEGTPAPIDPPKNLVVCGPYRFSRNPMYVSAMLMLLGEAALFASSSMLVYAAIAFIAFNLFVIFYEEPTLRKLFGEEYAQFCRDVPRWIGFGRCRK